MTQDLQENVESIQSVSIVTTIIEGKVDDYSIQHSVTSPYQENIQNIDIYDVVEMPDIPTRIAGDQVIEEFMLEEVVSDMTLPEIYRVDEKIHTDVQLEIPIIKSEEGPYSAR